MRVLVIGSLGNMGKRYAAICRILGQEVVECDISDTDNPLSICANKPYEKIDKCIIATPILSHVEWCKWCMSFDIPFLCEKPISKNPDEIRKLENGFMVNNWAHVFEYTRPIHGRCDIRLNYYSHGNDGVWDLIQPIYLAKEIPDIRNDSAVFSCSIAGEKVTREMFDHSFIRMVGAFLRGEEDLLWNMEDAARATEKVLRYIE